MSRQHASPIFIHDELGSSEVLYQVDRRTSSTGITEARIRDLVQHHPKCLPIEEIDPAFVGPVPICVELNTNVGRIDNFLVTPSGLPVLVECKLWRNPEGRREVVGQILDYAKELARWSSSDLQREVARRCPGEGNPLLRLLKDAGHDVDEIAFNDALTYNLRKGRFLLLIVGDGIREGVETIAEYLQRHLGLHFSLGLVEMPVFHHPNGGFIVTPRVLARTTLITRQVVSLPDGLVVEEDEAQAIAEGLELPDLANDRQAFWAEFLSGLHLDDPEQSIPRPSKQGYMLFTLPVPQGSAWITVWRDVSASQVGLTLGWNKGTLGETISHALMENFAQVSEDLGGASQIYTLKNGRTTISERIFVANLTDQATKEEAFKTLRSRLNHWINVLRPTIKSLVADVQGD